MAVTTVSNSLIFGGWVTKVLKNSDKKLGGGGGEWKGGCQQYFDFLVVVHSIKNATFLFVFNTRLPLH